MKNIITRLEKVENVCKKKPVIILAEIDDEERKMTDEEYIATPNAAYITYIKHGRLEDDLKVLDVHLQRLKEGALNV